MTFKLLGGSVLIVALGLTGAQAAQGAAKILQEPGMTFAREPGFTFTVPVKITGIRPEIKSGIVWCKVGAEGMTGDPETGHGGGAAEIRSDKATFTLDTSGSFSGNVVVHVGESSGRGYSQRPLSEATRYTCFFRFGEETSADARREAKPGTPIAQTISGTIPR